MYHHRRRRGYLGKSDIDEGVLSFHHGLNTADVSIEVIGTNGNAIYTLGQLNNLISVNFDPSRKTIVLANGWVHDAATKQTLHSIAKCTTDYNLIVVDFATNIAHLFRTAKHDTELATYALFKVIDTLLLNGCHYKDIIVAGYGVGAQIAAATCHVVAEQRLYANQRKLPLLVAIDPSRVCMSGVGGGDSGNCTINDNYIGRTAADKVLVIHGNNGIYGMPEAIGTVDYYPNGKCAVQPGCQTEVCSRKRAFAIFAEAICYEKAFSATKCSSWSKWQKGLCQKNEVIDINLNVPDNAQGKFYSSTNLRSPFGQGLKGSQPNVAANKRRPCFGSW